MVRERVLSIHGEPDQKSALIGKRRNYCTKRKTWTCDAHIDKNLEHMYRGHFRSHIRSKRQRSDLPKFYHPPHLRVVQLCLAPIVVSVRLIKTTRLELTGVEQLL
jgi:hypothetical protein